MTTKLTKNRHIILAAAAFAVIALLFGMWTRQNSQEADRPINLENGTMFPVPRDISPFHLVSADQKPFTNQNLVGKWSLLFFGFTQCPEMCPTTLAILNKTYQQLETKKTVPLPQVVFISVDPERDTPRAIDEYIGTFNKHFKGATGPKDQIKALTAQFNIMYMKVQNQNSQDANNYQIDHSGTLLLINPEGKLLALFQTPHEADHLAKDIENIEAHFNKHA